MKVELSEFLDLIKHDKAFEITEKVHEKMGFEDFNELHEEDQSHWLEQTETTLEVIRGELHDLLVEKGMI